MSDPRPLTDVDLARALKFAREEWSEDDLARRAIEELAEVRSRRAPDLAATLAKMEREGRDDGSARDALLSAINSHRQGHLDGWELHLVLSRIDREATASQPVAETVVGRGGPVTEASEVNVSVSEPSRRAPVAGDAARCPEHGARHVGGNGRTYECGCAYPGDAAPDETPAPEGDAK